MKWASDNSRLRHCSAYTDAGGGAIELTSSSSFESAGKGNSDVRSPERSSAVSGRGRSAERSSAVSGRGNNEPDDGPATEEPIFSFVVAKDFVRNAAEPAKPSVKSASARDLLLLCPISNVDQEVGAAVRVGRGDMRVMKHKECNYI